MLITVCSLSELKMIIWLRYKVLQHDPTALLKDSPNKETKTNSCLCMRARVCVGSILDPETRKVECINMFYVFSQLHRLTFWSRYSQAERTDIDADEEIDTRNKGISLFGSNGKITLIVYELAVNVF